MLANVNETNSHLVHLLNRISDPSPEGPGRATQQMLYLSARLWLHKQNARYKYLPRSIFRDPAWNMLIDMYVQEREGRAVATTSACAASGAPPSTALRWISSLEQAALISRISDAHDGRRTFLRLTPKARCAIEKWLLEPQ